MAKILDRFNTFFDPNHVERERDQAIEAYKDAQVFFGTETYKLVRAGLERRIKQSRWLPGMAAEDAAHCLVRQTTLQEVLEEFDAMISSVRENLDNG